jgi:hypothetical protein
MDTRLRDNIPSYFENECENTFRDYIITEHAVTEFVADKLDYLKYLISKKVILLDKIYDINSKDFMCKIIKTKFILNIENYEEFYETYMSGVKIYSIFENKIRQIFYCNMLINNKLYATMVKEDDDFNIKKAFNKLTFGSFRIDIGLLDYSIVSIYKIYNYYYEYKTYLRKYIPYLIRWDSKNNYYIVNRDYEYIGLNSKSIEFEKKGECYLFNDGTKPWDGKEEFIEMGNKYIKIIKENSLKECLNSNKFTDDILSLH